MLLLAGSTNVAHAEEAIIIDVGPEWALTVTGQVRPRLLAHSGLDFQGADSEWRELVTQRARLGLEAAAASGVGVTFQIQDVRIWGEEIDPSDSSAEGLDVHQAFVTLPILTELELRLGRLELELDDERLLGTANYTQRGRAFDGGRLEWRSLNDRYSIDALYAKVREPAQSPDGSVPDDVDGDIDFGGVHASMEIFPGHLVSPAYLAHVRQAPSHVRHTLGLHAKGASGGFSYRAEGYYQFGMLGDPAISAYLAALRLGYELDLPQRPGIQAWGELLSGDGTQHGAFDTLYGSNHAYYGEMDVFGALPRDTGAFGLVDVGGRLESDIVEGLRANVDGHWFRTASEPASGNANLGVEVDLKVRWRVMDYVTMDAMGGVFVPSEGMHGMGNVPVTGTLTPDLMAYTTLDVGF